MTKVESEVLFKKLYKQELSKGDQKRAEIALAAYELVDRVGFEKLTFDAIGAELGLKSAHIVYYFKDKKELLVAVLKILVLKAQETFVDAIKAHPKSKDHLSVYIAAAFDALIKQKSSRANVSLLFYYASEDEACRDIYLSAKAAGVERVTTMLQQDSALKSVSEKKLAALADDIMVMIHGRTLQCLIYQDEKMIKRFRDQTLNDVRALKEQL